MTLHHALRVVRVSAAYDLLITGGFALPFTAPALFTGLGRLHAMLGLDGSAPEPSNLYAVMFANLMGSVVVVWSGFRLARPSLAAGAADVAARALFSLGLGTALVHGASPLVGVMQALEIAWAITQGVALVGGARALDRRGHPAAD